MSTREEMALFITRHIFVVTDARPLYTWPEGMLGVEPDVDEVAPYAHTHISTYRYTEAYMETCMETHTDTHTDTDTIRIRIWRQIRRRI